jgi:hypothetical protein
MKYSIVILLFLSISTQIKSQKILGTGTNSDVVAALQPIQAALKELLMKKSMDYKLYESMDKSQKSLKAVYEAGEVLSQMKIAFEIVDMIKSYSCMIKQLDNTIANPKIKIPFKIENNINNASCIFEFEYQNVLSGLTLCLDIIEIVVTDVQMSLDQRLTLLYDVQDKMGKVAEQTIKLNNLLIYG